MRSFRLLSLIVAVIVLSSVPLSDTDGGRDDPLRIYEVLPTGQSEGFSLMNFSQTDIDLKGYVVSDGEGTVTFTSSLTIKARSVLTVLKAEPGAWYHVTDLRIMGTEGIVQKGFQLNDDGDEVVLKDRDGVTVDAFVYGSGSSVGGWSGRTFEKIPKTNIARRTSLFDTDSADDWSLVNPGRTSFPEYSFHGDAVPFVFPDSSGDPVMDALVNAEEEVLISMYILDHSDIVSILTELLKRGVSVRILLEGAPAGGVPDNEIGYMAALCRDGADVRLISSADGFKRYSYLHNKYAVIDSETVVVTSENWRYSSFTANRGWGVVIHSAEYGGYMRSVFLEDVRDDYGDIRTFSSVYPGANSSYVFRYVHEPSGYPSYPVTFVPQITPDFAYDNLIGLINSAGERVYSQQLGADVSWTADGYPLAAMASASSRGVDARLIVDVTFDSPYDNDTNDGYWVRDLMDGTGVTVMTSDVSGFNGLVHNKGLIVDGSVWVGSMNWNSSSFGNNREVGVLIHSRDVADVYAASFLTDWGTTYVEEIGLEVSITYVDGDAVLDASPSTVPPGTVFEWDLDLDGYVDRVGTKIVVSLPPGTRLCGLSVTDAGGVAHSLVFTVDVKEPSDGPPSYLKYIPVLAISVIVIAIRCILVRRSK